MKFLTETSSYEVISVNFLNGGGDEISLYRMCFRMLSGCSVVSGRKIMRHFGGYEEKWILKIL